MHLKINAVRVWIVAANIEEAGPEFESPLDDRFHPDELAAGRKRAKIVDAIFDLAAGVHPWESLLPVDLHQGEVPECPHLPVCLREMTPSFEIKQIRRFKWRERSSVLNSAG